MEIQDIKLSNTGRLLTSNDIADISAALAKAQAKMKHPARTKTAKVQTKTGGSYAYNYADLADVIDAVRGPFSENGLSFLQSVETTPGRVLVTTRLLHSSGQWFESSMSLTCPDEKPQTVGSAITYARRYSLAPFVGIASDDDDDASLAQGVTAEVTSRAKPASNAANLTQAAGARAGAPKVGVAQKTHEQRVAKMLDEFTKLGVNPGQIEVAMVKPTTELTDEDLKVLMGIYKDLKSGAIKPSDIGFE